MTKLIIDKILTETQPALIKLFHTVFGDEIENEAMQELIVSIQLYAAGCMRTAVELEKHE